MLKKAMIILADGFEEIEAVTCIDVLRRAGIQTTTAGLSRLEVKGSRGVTLTADQLLNDITQDFDACVIPGGMPGSTNIANSEKANSLIKLMHQEHKIIAAICAAPAIVLAPLGILDGKKATGYPGTEEKFGPNTKYSQDKVVTDKNLVTSQGPGTAMPFALKIAGLLAGEQRSSQVEEALLAD